MSRLSAHESVTSHARTNLQSLGGAQGSAVADPAALTSANLAVNSAAVKTVVTNVDGSGGGTAQTTSIGTIPAKSLLLGVQARVTTAFDGDTTRTFEVGVSGNIDAYIDTVDFSPDPVNTDGSNIGGVSNDVQAAQWIDDATEVIATWTNDASATAGVVEVSLIYVTFGESDLKTQVDALRADVTAIRTQLIALLTSLEGAGHIAS